MTRNVRRELVPTTGAMSLYARVVERCQEGNLLMKRCPDGRTRLIPLKRKKRQPKGRDFAPMTARRPVPKERFAASWHQHPSPLMVAATEAANGRSTRPESMAARDSMEFWLNIVPTNKLWEAVTYCEARSADFLSREPAKRRWRKSAKHYAGWARLLRKVLSCE